MTEFHNCRGSMQHYTDEMEDTSLFLIDVKEDGEDKIYVFHWVINHYERLIAGVSYSCHFIRIGKNIHRLRLMKYEPKAMSSCNRSPTQYLPADMDLNDLSEKYVLLGLTPTADFSFNVIAANMKMVHRSSPKNLLPHIPNRKGYFEFRENCNLFTCSTSKGRTLTAECKLVVVGQSTGDICIEVCNNLQSQFEDLFVSGKYHDVEIVVDKKTFKAHRIILKTRSKVLAAMLESEMREKTENKLVINDTDSDAFTELLRYIYCGKMKLPNPYFALNLLELADKYDLPHLQANVVEYLLCNLSVDYVLRTFVMADMHREKVLKEAAIEFIVYNLSKILNSEEWREFRTHTDLVDEILRYMEQERNNGRSHQLLNLIEPFGKVHFLRN